MFQTCINILRSLAAGLNYLKHGSNSTLQPVGYAMTELDLSMQFERFNEILQCLRVLAIDAVYITTIPYSHSNLKPITKRTANFLLLLIA